MRWVLTIFGLVSSWYDTDISSSSVLQNTVCPVLVALFSVGLILNIVLSFTLGSGSGSNRFGSRTDAFIEQPSDTNKGTNHRSDFGGESGGD